MLPSFLNFIMLLLLFLDFLSVGIVVYNAGSVESFARK